MPTKSSDAEARLRTEPPRAYGVSVEDEPIGANRTRRTLTLLLTARRCSFQCVYCDLWQHNYLERTAVGSIPTQIEAAIAAHPRRGNDSAIKLYNGGNFTDPTSIPATDWPAIATLCQPFARVIVENHATMCGDRLKQFRDLLSSQLEVAIGLETSNPDVLARQQKRMTLGDFARAADFLHRHAIAMRCFVLLQLPYADPRRCVAAAVAAVLHAVEAGAVFVAIIPTRSHIEPMQKLIVSGEFVPPKLKQLETALSESLAKLRIGSTTSVVTADTWDLESVAHCQKCQEDRIANIIQMNRSQQSQPIITCDFCSHESE